MGKIKHSFRARLIHAGEYRRCAKIAFVFEKRQSRSQTVVNASGDRINQWAHDVNAYLVCSDGNGHILLVNTWRSFDCPTGHKILINRSELNTHVPFDTPIKASISVGTFNIIFTNLFLVRFLVFSWDGNCLWNMSEWVNMKEAVDEPVQFGEEDGNRWRFETQDTTGNLTGLVLHDRYQRYKLAELEIRVRKW
ncbi:hypothetical protein FGIG_09682 [Fasciola gigantica]|uniref:Uncharacterized protein n=1 Tax=Fasciola gigantica TaxID=46835 RepID=A0A504Z1E5_FASGI|nr:hypothetical protein FGIG_09682 [Fasciola gigantica]